jgi:proteasome lid subunit RPN8/RPN11
MADKSDPLDVAQLAQRDLSETPFPGGKQTFRVYFDRQIHQRIAAHAAETLSLEICGVLVGHWHRDADGPFVLVNESIRCDKAVSNAGDVTFTHEAWNEVHQQMDTKFTDRAIVGWYHSHPNFGIFLSDRDLFIQEHFFDGPGQIAYVVDPVNGVEGLFAWRNGKARLYPHFWVGDEIHLSSQGAARKPSSASAAGQPPPSAPRPEALPPISSSMTWLLCAVCFLVLGYFLGGQLSKAERVITTRAAVTHYGVFKGLKLGMRENMNQVSNVMQNTAQRVVDLANEHISSLAGDAQEEKRKQWNEIVQNLKVTLNALEEINKLYSLTPDEAAEVERLIIAAKGAESENDQNPTAKDSAARDSGQKTSDAKTTEKPAAEPAKGTAAPPPGKAPDVKPLESKPADAAKAAATNQKP